MPDTFKTGTYEGKPTFSVMTGFNNKTGEPYWFTFGLKKAQGILDNIDQLRKWVDEKEKGQKQR
jgi:hypothetical protein